MKYDFILFGGTGQQGQICARDLLESGYSVMLAGRNKEGIKGLLKNKKAGFAYVDLSDIQNIINAIKKSGADVVINCAELTFNVDIMKACLKTGKSCTDLGGLQHVTVKQFALDREFRNKKLLCMTGCGSTPGISNVMAAYAIEKLDKINTIHLGFAWDSNIKKFVVPYSMQSIFGEFTEDPVALHDGKFVKESRLRCMGTFDFKEIGRQTTYCIVHSEVYTFNRYFKNKGLKNVNYMAGFPEHSFRKIRTLLDLGFDSSEPVEVGGVKIKPVDFTAKVLRGLKIPKGYKEVENIWVKLYGEKNGRKKEIEMNCIVKTVKGWEGAGSNIGTGRTISIISQMLKNGNIKAYGVHSPEFAVPKDRFFKELKKRKMLVYENGKRVV